MFAQRRLVGLIAGVALVVPMMVQAAPTADASAKELIQVTQLDNLLPMMANQASQASLPLLQQYFVKNKITLTEAQQKKAQEGLKVYADQQIKIVKDYFDSAAAKNELQGALVKGYTDKFTADELQQMVTFYKSSAGQKLMKDNTAITGQAVNTVLQSAQKAILPKMEKAAETYGKSIAKK